MSLWDYGRNAGLVLLGTWDADTNDPELTDNGGGGTYNQYYVVSVAGSTEIDGISSWEVGDWIINNGQVWERVPAQSNVSSVAGKTGAISLVKDDITDFTETDYAHTTEAETIDGVKTFLELPTIPETPVEDTDAASKGYVDSGDDTLSAAIDLKADDSAVVHLAGNETVAGEKTFSDAAIFGDVDAGDYSEFEQDTGVLRAEGDARLYKDSFISAYSLSSVGQTAPSVRSLFGSGNIKGLGFSGNPAAVNELSGTIEMQHDWAEGTDIVFHLHWMPEDTGAGDIKWFLDYSIQDVNGVFSAPTTVSLVVAAGGVAWKHKLSSYSSISLANAKIGSIMCFRVYRNGGDVADTYAGYAILMQAGIHYLCDTNGSRAITTK